MTGAQQAVSATADARRLRECAEEPCEDLAEEPAGPAEPGFGAELPLEVNMTDEPGGDPYNHTGRFRRMFR